MRKRTNTTIAKCKCRFNGCANVADVRRMKDHERGALYLVCPEHGVDKAASGRAQELLNKWVQDNTINPEVEPAPAPENPEQNPEPEKQPEPAPAPENQEPAPAKKGGFWNKAAAQFGAWLED